MFKSKPIHHDFNTKQAANYTARPAVLEAPNGQYETGVVLHSMGHIQGVLPVAEALRLANEIADALAEHHGKASE